MSVDHWFRRDLERPKRQERLQSLIGDIRLFILHGQWPVPMLAYRLVVNWDSSDWDDEQLNWALTNGIIRKDLEGYYHPSPEMFRLFKEEDDRMQKAYAAAHPVAWSRMKEIHDDGHRHSSMDHDYDD